MAILGALIAGAPAFGMEGTLNRLTLSNGLKVLVQEDHARKVATIQIWVKVGSADEEKSERGISHLIEHMAFKGTEKRGVGEIAKDIEALGGYTNAYTSWDETVFHVTVPSRATEEGLEILADAVLNPTIDPDELEKEKKVVLEEILEGEERPDRKSSKLLLKTTFSKSPYQYPVIGYKDTVASFTRDDIINFRKKWYVPENIFVLVVGDVSTDKLKPLLEEYLGGIESNGFLRPLRPTEPPQTDVQGAFLADPNSRETRLNIAFHVPSMESPDVNALDLAADILGARESSRLVRVLKKEKQLVHSIQAYAITPKQSGIFVVSARLDADKLEPATRAIMEEIAGLKKAPPEPDELERAKVNIESQHLYARETVEGVARAMGSFEADVGDALYEQKYLMLNQAVDRADVTRVVEEYLGAPNVTLTALIPEDQAEDFQLEPLTGILASYKTASKRAVEKIATGGIVTKTLDNGIKVVLAPDDSNPVVSVRWACLGGKRYETKDIEGVMNFIAQTIDKGTTDMTDIDIAQKIEDMGGRLKVFSGYDSFGVAATFFSRYLDEGLDLVSKLYTDPTFPQDKVDRQRLLILNAIKTEPDRPVQFAIRNLNETVFVKHPYGFNKEGTIETVSGFTRDDLERVYRRYAVPANTVISCVGDFDVPEALEKIEQVFGKIPTRPLDAPDVASPRAIEKQRDEVIRLTRAKTHVALGFIGPANDHKDRYALEVLSNMLSGQGGRLFSTLRDKESLAYIVASFYRPNVDAGVFGFYIATDPSKTEQALEGLFREIGKVRDDTIKQEEVDRAVDNLIGNHQIALQSSWARAENRGLNTLYGLGYDYEEKYVDKISQVTAADVKRVARQYLNPDKGAVVKILPEKTE
jgi:zinc protease